MPLNNYAPANRLRYFASLCAEGKEYTEKCFELVQDICRNPGLITGQEIRAIASRYFLNVPSNRRTKLELCQWLSEQMRAKGHRRFEAAAVAFQPEDLQNLQTLSPINVPVRASDGHLYDLSFLRHWFSTKHTSPFTRQTLDPIVYLDYDALHALYPHRQSYQAMVQLFPAEFNLRTTMHTVAEQWLANDGPLNATVALQITDFNHIFIGPCVWANNSSIDVIFDPRYNVEIVTIETPAALQLSLAAAQANRRWPHAAWVNVTSPAGEWDLSETYIAKYSESGAQEGLKAITSNENANIFNAQNINPDDNTRAFFLPNALACCNRHMMVRFPFVYFVTEEDESEYIYMRHYFTPVYNWILAAGFKDYGSEGIASMELVKIAHGEVEPYGRVNIPINNHLRTGLQEKSVVLKGACVLQAPLQSWQPLVLLNIASLSVLYGSNTLDYPEYAARFATETKKL